jgi:hypothetical protein
VGTPDTYSQGSFACCCYPSEVPLTILPLTKENAANSKEFFLGKLLSLENKSIW